MQTPAEPPANPCANPLRGWVYPEGGYTHPNGPPRLWLGTEADSHYGEEPTVDQARAELNRLTSSRGAA